MEKDHIYLLKYYTKELSKFYFRGTYKGMKEQIKLSPSIKNLVFFKKIDHLNSLILIDISSAIYLKPLKPRSNVIEIILDHFESYKKSKMVDIRGSTISYQTSLMVLKVVVELKLATMEEQTEVYEIKEDLDWIHEHKLLGKRRVAILSNKGILKIKSYENEVHLSIRFGSSFPSHCSAFCLSPNERLLFIAFRDLSKRECFIAAFRLGFSKLTLLRFWKLATQREIIFLQVVEVEGCGLHFLAKTVGRDSLLILGRVDCNRVECGSHQGEKSSLVPNLHQYDLGFASGYQLGIFNGFGLKGKRKKSFELKEEKKLFVVCPNQRDELILHEFGKC